MKKIFVLMLSVGLALGASAQHGHFGGGFGGRTVVVAPRSYVGVGVGFGLGYPWGYPYGWYGPWYGAYPPYYYGYGAMPSQLELQVRDIKKDYDAQIKDVKHDKSLTRQERREKVDQLKKQRDNDIVDARHAYFDNWRRNYYQNRQPQNNNNGNNNNNNNNGNNNNGNGNGTGNGSNGNGPEYQDKNSQAGQ